MGSTYMKAGAPVHKGIMYVHLILYLLTFVRRVCTRILFSYDEFDLKRSGLQYTKGYV